MSISDLPIVTAEICSSNNSNQELINQNNDLIQENRLLKKENEKLKQEKIKLRNEKYYIPSKIVNKKENNNEKILDIATNYNYQFSSLIRHTIPSTNDIQYGLYYRYYDKPRLEFLISPNINDQENINRLKYVSGNSCKRIARFDKNVFIRFVSSHYKEKCGYIPIDFDILNECCVCLDFDNIYYNRRTYPIENYEWVTLRKFLTDKLNIK